MKSEFALAVALLGACAVESAPREPAVALGGGSPLVDVFARVGSETGIPPELLAAMSYVETRLSLVNSSKHGATRTGLLGLSDGDVAIGARLAGVTDTAARTEPEASVRAAAALIRAAAPGSHSLADLLASLEPRLRAEVTAALVRGVDGRDSDGRSVVITARPQLAERGGFGEITQALGAADYAPAHWVPALSSNYAVANRGLTDITHVVIHTVEGSYSSCINWFQDPEAQVSAHYVVRSVDGDITQMVAEKNKAWHDGCFNNTTIGIEHEGYEADPDRWYTEAMYVQSAKLTTYLADKYNIAKTHEFILGHGDAPDCSDHEDPGPGWDWDHYLDLVNTGGSPRLGASDALVDAPLQLVSGERATVTVRATNKGNTRWDLDLTRLGTAAPQDRESAFFVDGDWPSPARATGIDARVAPGETGTFTFDVIAPEVRETTMFDETFQLVEEGVGWFGPEIHVVLQVAPGPTDPSLDDGGCSAGGGAGSAGSACAMALLGVLSRMRRRSARRR